MRALTLILAFMTLFPALAMGQEEAVPMPGPEGDPGVWFPLPDAQLALQAREEAERFPHRVRLLRESLTLAERQVEALERAVAVGQEAEGALESALDHSAEALQAALLAQERAEDALGAWWRHPGFWTAVGAVLGGVLVGVLAAAL